MTAVWLGPVAQWLAFIIFTVFALAGGLGMVTTTSMFRRGIFLMVSFIGVAGLFLLLQADLLALLQIMMYVGGMLVMILFMVLFAHDPGGVMMASMKMPLIEQFFSQGLKPEPEESEGHATGMHSEIDDRSPDVAHAMHVEGSIEGRKGEDGSYLPERSQEQEVSHEIASHHPGAMTARNTHEGMMGGMKMGRMVMTTPIKRLAAILAILTGAMLISFLWLHPAWRLTIATPDPRSAERVGSLLMSKYMIAFEGASLLILTGIFGSVLLARSGRLPASLTREDCVAVEEPPPPIEDASLEPSREAGDLEPEVVTEIQRDERD